MPVFAIASGSERLGFYISGAETRSLYQNADVAAVGEARCSVRALAANQTTARTEWRAIPQSSFCYRL